MWKMKAPSLTTQRLKFSADKQTDRQTDKPTRAQRVDAMFDLNGIGCSFDNEYMSQVLSKYVQ